jgi:hypothetical protein
MTAPRPRDPRPPGGPAPAAGAASTLTDHRDVLMLRAMALGFGIGSFLFALGTVFVWMGLSPDLANVTYALGAVGFTSAATVQWRASVVHHPWYERLRLRAESDLTNPDWTSAVTQLIGTLFFNVMTIRAVLLSLADPNVDYTDVWGPDVYGSALFLVSSWIAWHPIARHRRHRLISGRSAWICWANMTGSVFFALSAWGARMLPNGQLQSVTWNNLGTFVGAIGFLVASILLWPCSGQSDDPTASH